MTEDKGGEKGWEEIGGGGSREGAEETGGKKQQQEHPGSYLSSFTGGFPGLELPFGKEGTRKGYAVSPEDPFKKNASYRSHSNS